MISFARFLPSFIPALATRIRTEPSLQHRQQLISFILYSFSLVTGLVINLCGWGGPQSRLTMVLNAVFLGMALLLIACLRFGHLSLAHTFCALAIVAQLFTCNEMILCAVYPTDYRLMLIAANVSLLIINIMFSVIAYLKTASYILGTIAMAAYAACVVITGDKALLNFFAPFVLIMLTVTILGSLLAKNLRQLHEENMALKREEENIIRALRVEKSEILAYVKLSQQDYPPEETRRILDMLDDLTRDQIIRNVSTAIKEQELQQYELAGIFPELSRSEIVICRLILRGMTLNEITTFLCKSEGNITSQRSNIRKKLGLQAADNLHDALRTRFNEAKASHSAPHETHH